MDTRGGACRGRKRAGSIIRASQGSWHLSDGDSPCLAVRRRERPILVAGERHFRCFPTGRQGIFCPVKYLLKIDRLCFDGQPDCWVSSRVTPGFECRPRVDMRRLGDP